MESLPESMQKPRNHAPLLFTLATSLVRHKVRGGSRLLQLIQSAGLLDRPVRYPLGGGLHIDVPISRLDNCWDRETIDSYETEAIECFTTEARRLSAPIAYIDCGADIGIFALKVAALLKLAQVFVIEPDPGAFPWLQSNVRQVNGKAVNCAAGSFAGRGRLEFPDYYPNHPHAQFLVNDPQGPIQIVRLDDLESNPGSLAIKIDVEGGELEVLRGAEKKIRSSTGVVILFEAHAQVIRRTGIHPVECMRFLEGIRPFHFFVTETGEQLSTASKFELPLQICNIIASTVTK